MKDKVVVFTDNNARILINPDINQFRGKKNTHINPDLNLVKGIEPHYWKPLSMRVKLHEAIRLRDLISSQVDWTSEEPIHEQVFYKEAFVKLNEEINLLEQSTVLLSKLLNRIDGISLKDISDHLESTLIQPTTSSNKVKENKIMSEFVSKFRQGPIVPMDEDERLVRDNHIKKYGVINSPDLKKRMYYIKYLPWVITIAMMGLLLWKR